MHAWLANTGIGLVVGLISIWIAVVQIRKANSAKSEMRRLFLVLLLPRLTEIERNMGSAVRNKDVDQVAIQLLAWPYYAAQLRGLLDEGEDGLSEIRTSIQESIALSSATRIALDSDGTDFSEMMKDVQTSIAVVTTETVQLSMKYAKGS